MARAKDNSSDNPAGAPARAAVPPMVPPIGGSFHVSENGTVRPADDVTAKRLALHEAAEAKLAAGDAAVVS